MTMQLTVMVALLSVLGVAPEGPDAATKNELARFQGVWTVVSVEKDGRTATADQLVGFKIVVEGNSRIVKNDDQVLSRSTLKLDLSKEPKVIYLTMTEGMFKGNTLPAIYEMDGDTWKVCLALNGVDPPQAFATQAGDGHLLHVYRKEKQ
jgi:uncharacterized protein (TIGR03067 family)